MQIIRKIISLKKYSFLLLQLVKRDFTLKYRGSFLGVLWSMFNPLLNMIVLSIVFSQVFKAVDNYKMFLLSGICMFNFFSDSTNLAVISVTNSFGLITKVYFPKFIIPLSKVLSASINFCITIVVFLILGSYMNVTPWIGYFIIPYVLVCLLFFVAGISFVISALQVFFRDTQHIYGVLMTIWMYITPILYPIEVIPVSLQPIFKINPMYIFIDFLRQLTLYSTVPDLLSFLYCAVWGIGVFIIGAFIFVKLQKRFIYYT